MFGFDRFFGRHYAPVNIDDDDDDRTVIACSLDGDLGVGNSVTSLPSSAETLSSDERDLASCPVSGCRVSPAELEFHLWSEHDVAAAQNGAGLAFALRESYASEEDARGKGFTLKLSSDEMFYVAMSFVPACKEFRFVAFDISPGRALEGNSSKRLCRLTVHNPNRRRPDVTLLGPVNGIDRLRHRQHGSGALHRCLGLVLPETDAREMGQAGPDLSRIIKVSCQIV